MRSRQLSYDSEEHLSELMEDAVIHKAERVMSPRQANSNASAHQHHHTIVGGGSGEPYETPSRSPVRTPEKGDKPEYEIETICVANGDEIKWEIVVRRKRPTTASTGSAAAAPSRSNTGPVHISNTQPTITSAPVSASSLNLALSLDQPRGKLAFLSLPSMSEPLHQSTPTPLRSRSFIQPQGATAGGGLGMGTGSAKTRGDVPTSPSPARSYSAGSNSTNVLMGWPLAHEQPPSVHHHHHHQPQHPILGSPLAQNVATFSPASFPTTTTTASPAPAPPTPSSLQSSTFATATTSAAAASPPCSPREVVVKQRRQASLQGGVLYTRNIDA